MSFLTFPDRLHHPVIPNCLIIPNFSCARATNTESGFTAVVGPQLERAAAGLEFLELGLSLGPAPISHMPTELNLELTSTTFPFPTIPYASSPPLLLPSLLSLKVTLDNATFSVLPTWAMPALQNLDFSYTGEGFAAFFEVHGDKLRQLKLGD